MSLRTRIAAAASIAVALAVLAAAVAVYVAVRSDLRGQVDRSLDQRAQGFVAAAQGRGLPGPPQGRPPDDLRDGDQPPSGARSGGAQGARPFPSTVAPARFGGASGYVQFIAADGSVDVPGGQGSSPKITPSVRDRAIAARGSGRALSDRTVNGTHLRVLTLGVGARTGAAGEGAASGARPGAPASASAGTGGTGAVMIARPLAEVDDELGNVLLILIVVGVAGIAIAALLGTLVARTALTPIVRFTKRTEALTGEMDLSQRLQVDGRDELARLAASFNLTLDALERSLSAQRQLIADASHELRTPLASLRANVQTLEDAARLPVAEQQSLRRDIIDELDELTSLVSDVVELARGTRVDGVLEDVRLDRIVADVVERTRRRAELSFELDLQPTVVSGEADRINRAVSNLLDNARKWSPPDGLIEVGLHDGVLSVRDHGPGFEQDEPANVFERFYRADSARKLPGSGLGLAIVRQAAEAHHGYARAENAPGGGARLLVSFGPPLEVAGDGQAPPAAPGA